MDIFKAKDKLNINQRRSNIKIKYDNREQNYKKRLAINKEEIINLNIVKKKNILLKILKINKRIINISNYQRLYVENWRIQLEKIFMVFRLKFSGLKNHNLQYIIKKGKKIK